MIGCSSKKKGQRKAAALKVWGSITSRGEQPTRGPGGEVRTSTTYLYGSPSHGPQGDYSEFRYGLPFVAFPFGSCSA